MIVSLSLVVYAAVIAGLAPRVLARCAWVQGSPRLGVLAWLACVTAVLSSVALVSWATVAPVERLSVDVGHVIHACASRLPETYGTGLAQALAVVAVAVPVLAAARLSRVLVLHSLRLRRERAGHRDFLDLLGVAGPDGEEVVDFDLPLAYCVPGGRGRIVLTQAAVSVLTPSERAAVLAHERAHLRARHDVVLLSADVAGSAFRFVPFFQTARRQVQGLVEMLADDAAARTAGPGTVASALVGLGPSVTPRGALGAAEHMTDERVQRLLRPQLSLSRWRRAAVSGLATAVAVTPWVMVVAPAWAARHGLCFAPL